MKTAHGRIVGGYEVDISEYPWQLSLRYFNVQACGASIISENWALTAAHCVYGYVQKELNEFI